MRLEVETKHVASNFSLLRDSTAWIARERLAASQKALDRLSDRVEMRDTPAERMRVGEAVGRGEMGTGLDDEE